MKSRYFFYSILFVVFINNAQAQSYIGDKFLISTKLVAGHNYTLYDFSRAGTVIKAKYFAINAYQKYLRWRKGKNILLVTAGAFSDSYSPDGIPVGLCMDNGQEVNDVVWPHWDGMVIIYNGSTLQGGVAVVDLSLKPVTVEYPYGSRHYFSYNIRSSADKLKFIEWGKLEGVTVFQSQLLYSTDKTTPMSTNYYYGDKKERRFLAICKKNGIVHHVVVDGPDQLQLNLSTWYAKSALESTGLSVNYIINLDTGDKNILFVYDGKSAVDQHPYKGKRPKFAKIQGATNLLIYYTD